MRQGASCQLRLDLPCFLRWVRECWISKRRGYLCHHSRCTQGVQKGNKWVHFFSFLTHSTLRSSQGLWGRWWGRHCCKDTCSYSRALSFGSEQVCQWAYQSSQQYQKVFCKTVKDSKSSFIFLNEGILFRFGRYIYSLFSFLCCIYSTTIKLLTAVRLEFSYFDPLYHSVDI